MKHYRVEIAMDMTKMLFITGKLEVTESDLHIAYKNEQGDRQKTVYGIRTTYITLQDFEAKSNREAAETLLEIYGIDNVQSITLYYKPEKNERSRRNRFYFPYR